MSNLKALTVEEILKGLLNAEGYLCRAVFSPIKKAQSENIEAGFYGIAIKTEELKDAIEITFYAKYHIAQQELESKLSHRELQFLAPSAKQTKRILGEANLKVNEMAKIIQTCYGIMRDNTPFFNSRYDYPLEYLLANPSPRFKIFILKKGEAARYYYARTYAELLELTTELDGVITPGSVPMFVDSDMPEWSEPRELTQEEIQSKQFECPPGNMKRYKEFLYGKPVEISVENALNMEDWFRLTRTVLQCKYGDLKAAA